MHVILDAALLFFQSKDEARRFPLNLALLLVHSGNKDFYGYKGLITLRNIYLESYSANT